MRGVELLDIRVADTPELTRRLMACLESGLDPISEELYLDNRIRLFRMSEFELNQLLEDASLVGGSGSVWCGQVLEWTPITQARIGRSLIEVMDETLLMEDGTLSILGRIWVEPTLDGAWTRLELVPRYESDLRSPVSVLRASRRRNLLFRELSVETAVPSGEVILLTGRLTDPDQVDGLVEEIDPQVPEDDEASAPRPVIDLVAESESESARPLPEPAPPVIPETFGLGDALFIGPPRIPDGPAERLLLVIVPRIPESMLQRDPNNESPGSGP